MIDIIIQYGMTVLDLSEEAERLAGIYIADGAVSAKHFADAVHIAMATVSDLDFIVSFNFQHIVKRKTMNMTESMKAIEG
jgi:hypothetical protein